MDQATDASLGDTVGAPPVPVSLGDAADAPPISPAAFTVVSPEVYTTLRAMERGGLPLLLPGTRTTVQLPRSSPLLPIPPFCAGGWAE